MKKLLQYVILLLTLTTCSLPVKPGSVGSSGEPSVVIDSPLNGMTLPLEAVGVVYRVSAPSGLAKAEFSVNGELVAEKQLSAEATILTLNQSWQPPAPGNYTLQVRVQDATGNWSSVATVLIVIIGVPSATPMQPSETIQVTSADTPTPTFTLVPSPVPTLTFTPIPTVCDPQVTLLMNATCHAAPDLASAVVMDLAFNQTLGVVGRNALATWWYLLLPNGRDHCWAPASAMQASCVALVPVINIQPTATPSLGGPLFRGVQISTARFFWGGCEPSKVAIRIEVDDPTGVSNVTIVYRMRDNATGERSDWLSKPLSYNGAAIWEANLVSDRDFVSSPPPYTTSTLAYYFIAVNSYGISSQSDTYRDITLTQCGS